MSSEKSSDDSSSDNSDSEDNLPVQCLKPKSENVTEIVSMDDPEAHNVDLSMTVETAIESDNDTGKPKKNNRMNKIKHRKSTKLKDANDESESQSDTISSSDTDGEIPSITTYQPPLTHRNQYFKSFKFGPPIEPEVKLPEIMMPEGFGEPISVVPIKQEYNDDEEPPVEQSMESIEEPPKVKVEEVPLKTKPKKVKSISDADLAQLNAKFVFLCQMCQEPFTDVELLNEHLLTHDQQGTYLCKTCDRVYQNIKDLRLHMICHIKSGSFKCEDCGKMYHHTQSLMAHRKRWHTEERPHFCEVCGKTFSLKNDLTTHMRSHSSDRHHCEYCNKAFRTDRYLRIHTKHVHLGYKYALIECNICHKTFQKKNLLTHKKLHEEKVHKCHYCGKCMTTSYSLIAHIRRHEGIKPFVCQICNKAFVDKGKLARHLHSHKGTRDYQCDLCEKSFSESQYLRQHKRTHDHTKRYPCKVCGTMFKSMNSVWSHMRKHTHTDRYDVTSVEKHVIETQQSKYHAEKEREACGEAPPPAPPRDPPPRPYPCVPCNKRFTSAARLALHCKRKSHAARGGSPRPPFPENLQNSMEDN